MLQIAIIGMGLVGTSLGMALRSADEKEALLGPVTIVGYDKDPHAVTNARGRLAIDRPARNLEDALHEAQLVILAVPPQALREVLATSAPLLPHGAVVTDVASTKAQILEWVRELLPRTVDFIGGHPMAGKEQSGAAAADPKLFKGAVYCLTPTPLARPTALELVDAMVQQIGAKPYYIDPVEHDSYVGGISHLPFLLSTLLVEVTSRSPAWKEMAPLAATGFRDMSRLASGDVEMHHDICMTNQAALTRWIDDMIALLLEVRSDIETSDSEKIQALFTHAREVREVWLASRPNVRPGETDFENMGGVDVQRPSLFGRFGSGRPPRSRR